MPLAIFHRTALKGRQRSSCTLHSVANAWYMMRLTTGLVNATRLAANTIRPKRLSATSHLTVFPYPLARACLSTPSWSTACASRLAVTWAENRPSLFNRDPTASPMMANRSPKAGSSSGHGHPGSTGTGHGSRLDSWQDAVDLRQR